MTGRRLLEIAVLAFGAVFLAVVVYSFRPGRRPSAAPPGALPHPPASQEAGQAMTVSRGFDYTETVGGKPLFRIQSERTVGFGPAAGLVPNVYALEEVSLTLYPEESAPVTVRAEKAQYDRRTNEAMLSGNVRWSDEKGALGETSRIEFHPSAHEFIAPAAIHFARGTFNVRARSGRYDLQRRELTLSGPVEGSGTGEGSEGLSELAADGATYRRDEGRKRSRSPRLRGAGHAAGGSAGAGGTPALRGGPCGPALRAGGHSALALSDRRARARGGRRSQGRGRDDRSRLRKRSGDFRPCPRPRASGVSGEPRRVGKREPLLRGLGRNRISRALGQRTDARRGTIRPRR